MAEPIVGREATARIEEDKDFDRHELDEGGPGSRALVMTSRLPGEITPRSVAVAATPRLSTIAGGALLPGPTAESWEYPLTREEKFHRVLGLMEAELFSADGRANRLEQACPAAAAGQREEEAEERAKRLELELLSMHAIVAKKSQEARTSRWNARENADLKARIELCKSVLGTLMTNYDFPEDVTVKMQRFLKDLIPTRTVVTADGEEADEEEDRDCRGPGNAGATGEANVFSQWRELSEAIQKADEPAPRTRRAGKASRPSSSNNSAREDKPMALEDEESIWARSKAILAELWDWSVDPSTTPPDARR